MVTYTLKIISIMMKLRDFINEDNEIELDMLSRNPSMFTYDYERIAETTSIFKEELMAAA